MLTSPGAREKARIEGYSAFRYSMRRATDILAMEYADSPGNVTLAAPEEMLITVPVGDEALKVVMK